MRALSVVIVILIFIEIISAQDYWQWQSPSPQGNVLFSEEIPVPGPNRKLVKTVDLSGREISKPEKNQPFIEIYDDGSTKKKINLK